MSKILLSISLFCLTLLVTSSYAFSDDGISIQHQVYQVEKIANQDGSPLDFSGDVNILTGFTTHFDYKMIRHREICTYGTAKTNRIHLTKYAYFIREKWSV